MKSGDLVELREPSEILATLDPQGSLQGLPFMPEMLDFFGQCFTVKARVERACDTITPQGVRRMPGTVVLDGPRCSGSGHGGCGARCLLYWKEDWLRPAPSGQPSAQPRRDEGYEELKRLVDANAQNGGSAEEEPTFRCQATQFQCASERVWWRSTFRSDYAKRSSLRSLVGEVFNGNVSVVRFARVMARTVYEAVGQWTRLRFARPFKATGGAPTASEPPRGLLPGDVVQVRSKAEIARTLDANGKNKGLWFDREMLPYCGATARVLARVDRFIDERTGRLVELKSDCYILEGVICSGDLSVGRRFCVREIYPWWRECWLRRLDADQPPEPGSLIGAS
jgi:hypothetical protein